MWKIEKEDEDGLAREISRIEEERRRKKKMKKDKKREEASRTLVVCCCEVLSSGLLVLALCCVDLDQQVAELLAHGKIEEKKKK